MYRYIILIIIASCTFTPKYQSPDPTIKLEEKNDGISNIEYKDFFISHKLRKVIDEALENNLDLRLAVINAQILRQQYVVAKSPLFPSINAYGSYFRSNFPDLIDFIYGLGLSATYELDLFGQVQSLKDAAFESYLGSEENARSVKLTIMTEAASLYIALISQEEVLELSKKIVDLQKEKLKITEEKYKHKILELTDLLSVKADLETANINYNNNKNLAENTRNSLLFLIGKQEVEILNLKTSLNEIKINERFLENTPSSQLLLRPDIRQAENLLKAANANIGAARSAFFPSILITGQEGFTSNDLSSLFNRNYYMVNPQVTLPLFTGWNLTANLEIAKLQKNSAVVSYQQTVQNAFFEALNGLTLKDVSKRILDSKNKILKIQATTLRISTARYEAGTDDKIANIDAKINLLSAEINYKLARANYLISLSNLYKVLGGGSRKVSLPN